MLEWFANASQPSTVLLQVLNAAGVISISHFSGVMDAGSLAGCCGCMAAIVALSGSVVALGVSITITLPRALLLPYVAKDGLAGDAILHTAPCRIGRMVGLQ